MNPSLLIRFTPETPDDWRAEVRRAVNALSRHGQVPTGAAELLTAETEAELWRILERLGVDGDPWQGPKMSARVEDLAAREHAMWRPEPDGLAPMDAALLRALEALGVGDDERRAIHDAAREATGEHERGPAAAWRTHHKTLHGVIHTPSGTEWPPREAAGWLAEIDLNERADEWRALYPWCTDEAFERLLELWREAMERNDFYVNSARVTLEHARRELARFPIHEAECLMIDASMVATPGRAELARAVERAEAGVRQAETLPVQRAWREVHRLLQGAEWVAEGWVPPLRLTYLAEALWKTRVKAEWERRERARRSAGPVQGIHPAVRSIVAGGSMGALVATKTGAVDLEDETGARVRGWIQPAAAVSLPGDRLETTSARFLPGLLVAVLAKMVFQAAKRGDSHPLIVTIPASIVQLKQLFGGGIEYSEEELDEAIDFLRSVAIAGGVDGAGRARADWFLIEKAHTEKRMATGGGRPALVRVIHCGWPLAPWALKKSYQDHRVDLPSELRFVSGVLDPASVPVVGDNRTREQQRLAMSLGFPAWMMRNHREQYAERGGIRLQAPDVRLDWESYAKNEWGLYVRKSYASLPERVLEAAVFGELGRGRVPKPVLPGMPGGPVLVETEPGSGLYRMADEGQHALLLEAGGKTVEQRGRRLRGLERERKRVEKAQRPSRRRT